MNLKDYAQYYIGCRCMVDFSRYVGKIGKNFDIKSVPCYFDSINRNTDIDQCWGVTVDHENGFEYYDVFDSKCTVYSHFIHSTSIKIILRRLEDMTDEECLKINEISPLFIDGASEKYIRDRLYVIRDRVIYQHLTPAVFHYLLKQGFDLFSLLENGLAIDAATLPK